MKKTKIPYILHILTGVLTCLSIMWIMAMFHFTIQNNGLYIEGTYEYSDGIQYELSSDTTIPTIPNDTLLIKGEFNREVLLNENIYMDGIGEKFEFKINNFVAYVREGETLYPVELLSKGIPTNDTIEIQITNIDQDTSIKDVLNTMISLPDYQLLFESFTNHIFDFISSFAILLVGAILLLLSFCIWKTNRKFSKTMLYFSGFVLSCGIWFMSDYEFFAILMPTLQLMRSITLLSIGFVGMFAAGLGLMLLKKEQSRRWLYVPFSTLIIMQTVNFILLVAGNNNLMLLRYLLIGLSLCTLSMLLYCMYTEIWHAQKKLRPLIVAMGVVFIGILLDVGNNILLVTDYEYINQSLFLISLVLLIYGIVKYVMQTLIQQQKHAELEKELMQSKISVMLSQIKPHFLFNALNAISALCLTDPLQADAVIVKFSEYLRENINSLETQAPIAFTKELHHVKNYVEIEQVRFQEKLRVEYDIQFEDFVIPTLTLQPIVENAIRHGIGKKTTSGTVWISTYLKDNKIYITVKDDGVGFSMKDSSYLRDESIGMKNVRSRLEAMIHGEMQIASEVKVGTEISIIIPQKEEK